MDKSAALIGLDARDIVVSHWTKTFLGGKPPPFISDHSTPGTPVTSDPVSDLLNSIFQDVYVTSDRETYIIVGPRERVRQIKIMFARWLDVPYPTVNLNVMAFQASTRNYQPERIADAVELATAGLAISREFLALYSIDFSHFVGRLQRRQGPTVQATEGEEEKIRELFAKFHLVEHRDFDGSTFNELKNGTGRVEPFVDDLAYLLLYRPDDIAPLGSFMQGQDESPGDAPEDRGGRALRFLNLVELQLVNTYKRLSGAQPTEIAEFPKLPDPAKDPLEQTAKDILKNDPTSAQISEDRAIGGKLKAARLISLCREIRRAAYPALPTFTKIFTERSEQADLDTVLRFLYEYSLPNSYTEVAPHGNHNRLFVIEKERTDLETKRRDAETARQWLSGQLNWSYRYTEESTELARQTEILKAQKALIDAQKAFSSKPSSPAASDLLVTYLADLAKMSAAESAEPPSTNKSAFAKYLASLKTLAAKEAKDLTAYQTSLKDGSTGASDAKAGGSNSSMPAPSLPAPKDLLSAKQLLDSDISTLTRDIDALDAERRELRNPHFEGVDDASRSERELGGGSLREPTRPVDPEYLVNESANVDYLLRNASNAYARDIEAGVIDPLTTWIQANNRGHKDGLVLTGNLALAVTSSMGASSEGTSTFYQPYTPQQQLTAAQLTSLFGVASGLQLLSSQGIEAVLKTFASLGAPQTTYATVAPGLDLSVLPTVLPGGRSARLQIDFKASDQVKDDPNRAAHIPYVNSHEIRTDVAVNTFDLFPLSTFNIETTTLGDPQWRIYGLEGIPIIGNIFIGPRRPVTSLSRSLVIVYSTVLPRSLDLARRYSSDSD